MKALIFAAGLGTRLRPLTLAVPKPLLPLAGKPMLQWHIERLVRCGVTDLIINSAWLAEQIEAFAVSAGRLGARLVISHEPDGPYDTGGAIRHCRHLLADSPFLVLAGDVWTTYPFERLLSAQLGDALGRLVMVPNPPQHPDGDFALRADGRLSRQAGGNRYTYSGLALLHPAIIDGFDTRVFALRDALRRAASASRLCGELWEGDWEDVGTVARYEALNHRLMNPPDA